MKKTVYFKLFIHFAVSIIMFSTLIHGLSTALSPTSSTTIPKVVLDAGHGGIDKGTFGINTGVCESNLNLDYVLTLEQQLANYEIQSVLTRTDSEGLYGDTSPGFKRRDMEKRREIATNSNADLLVSLHCNYSSAKSPQGVVIYYNSSVPLSKTLALELQKNISPMADVKKVRIDTEVMFMTHSIDIPSVLIECGFLSNPSDELLLTNVTHRQLLTQKIATSIKNVLYDYVDVV